MQNIPTVLSIIALLLLSLACSLTSGDPHPLPAQAEGSPAPLPVASPARYLVQAANTPEPEPLEVPARCVVIAQALNVRACPGVTCAVIGWLEAGNLVQAAPAPGVSGWLEITTPPGGYISARWCEFPEG